MTANFMSKLTLVILVAYLLNNVGVESKDRPVAPDASTSENAEAGKPGKGSQKGADENVASTRQTDKMPSLVEQYQRLFRLKRMDQREALKNILATDGYEKRYKLVTILLNKVLKVLGQAKIKLMESGYVPGDPFPTDETTRDIFSTVLENTVFFGDLLLRFPDVTHSILSEDRNSELVTRWCVGFANETGVLEKNEVKLISLMAQELKLVERDPNYMNPYKAETEELRLKEEIARKKDEKEKAQAQKLKKKLEKKKKRGPRLSGSRNEL